MEILVTGAAGFIGSHLAQRLVQEGHTVCGLDCLTSHYDRSLKRANVSRLEALGVHVWQRDLAEDPLTDVVDGVEAIYHLAAQPGLSAQTPRSAFVRNNVRATERLLAAAADQSSVNAFVFTSSSSVYGADATGTEDAPLSPVSTYGRTKCRAEQIVGGRARDAEWAACIVRLFSVYGPRERPDKLFHKAIRCVRTGRPFPLYEGSGAHRRSFTYVDDVVDGLVSVLNRFRRCAGETINLGSPRAVSTCQALDVVAEVAERPLRVERAPARVGDQRHTRADIRKARRLLGVTPNTSLREGIAAEMAWMEDAKAVEP